MGICQRIIGHGRLDAWVWLDPATLPHRGKSARLRALNPHQKRWGPTRGRPPWEKCSTTSPKPTLDAVGLDPRPPTVGKVLDYAH